MSFSREIAWLAGLFEGEGSISRKRKPAKGCTRTPWVLQMQMTDEDIVRRAHAVAGAGNVTGPYMPKRARKETWTWSVTKRSEVYFVLCMLYPWFGHRRKAKAREALEDLPPVGYPLRGESWKEARGL